MAKNRLKAIFFIFPSVHLKSLSSRFFFLICLSIKTYFSRQRSDLLKFIRVIVLMKRKFVFLGPYDASFPNLVDQAFSLIEFALKSQSNKG